jgi:hypothetical protein
MKIYFKNIISYLCFSLILALHGNYALFALNLHESYSMERTPIKIEGIECPVHLYPTDKIKKFLSDYQKSDEANQISFAEYINKHKTSQDIDISTDTTIYLPREYVITNHRASLDDNKQLVINGIPLKDGEYIFVITDNNDLLIAQKLETPKGRIQHSSLSGGDPVKSAGLLWIETDAAGQKQYKLRSYSGHYRPEPSDLELVLKWFEDRSDALNIISDEITRGRYVTSRVVVFTL